MHVFVLKVNVKRPILLAFWDIF